MKNKKYYSIIVEDNKSDKSPYSSYFGLDEYSKDIIVKLLDTLKVNYDIYSFIKEKRFKLDKIIK